MNFIFLCCRNGRSRRRRWEVPRPRPLQTETTTTGSVDGGLSSVIVSVPIASPISSTIQLFDVWLFRPASIPWQRCYADETWRQSIASGGSANSRNASNERFRIKSRYVEMRRMEIFVRELLHRKFQFFWNFRSERR